MPFERRVSLPDEMTTTQLGRALAGLLKPGDVFLLDGPIGAGKTHFVRSVIQARLERQNRIEDVPSPTYTLVQTYDDGTLELWHADLYRLTSPEEVIELGLDEAFETAVSFVEWPDRLGDLAPLSACRLAFSYEGDGRQVVIEWDRARLDDWMSSFAVETAST